MKMAKNGYIFMYILLNCVLLFSEEISAIFNSKKSVFLFKLAVSFIFFPVRKKDFTLLSELL